jgi:Zn ribbon nucleic-acid-binding protein
LTTASGAPLKFWRMLDEPCPICGRGSTPNKLAILHESQAQETVHCMACDYQQTRRPTMNPQVNPQAFRPMNT